jgi:hypothetical protein
MSNLEKALNQGDSPWAETNEKEIRVRIAALTLKL